MFKKRLVGAVIIISILACSFIGCSNHNRPYTSDLDNIDNTTSNFILKNSCIYINDDNQLILHQKDTNTDITVSSNVIDFNDGNSFLAYTSKDSSGKHLTIYHPETNEYNKFKEHYSYDYIVCKDMLFYINNMYIESYNVNTREVQKIYNVITEDLVFNYVDDEMIIFSSIINGIPTTQKYSFTDNVASVVCTNATNITVLDDYIYGLTDDLNMFRIDSMQNIEAISDFKVLKFYINKNYLVYIDDEGSLNSLDLNGNNRLISDSASDFKVIENNLYFTTMKKPGFVYKTQLTGQHKELLLTNINTNFYFKEVY